MKKTLVASLVAVSLGVASVAAAADFSGFAGKGSGFYVGGNVGYAEAGWKKTDFQPYDGYGSYPVTNISDTKALTYGLDVGYMFNANLGMEVAYDMYHKNNFKSGSTNVGQVKSQNYPSILSVWNLPVNNQWNVFAKLGATYLTTAIEYVNSTDIPDVKIKVWAPTAALGVGYNVMQNVNVNTQVKVVSRVNSVTEQRGVAGSPVTPSYTALTVGVNYKF